jgi:hypothetical protein
MMLTADRSVRSFALIAVSLATFIPMIQCSCNLTRDTPSLLPLCRGPGSTEHVVSAPSGEACFHTASFGLCPLTNAVAPALPQGWLWLYSPSATAALGP